MWTNLTAHKFISKHACRAPNDAWFACLWCTRTKLHPLQACPVSEIDPLNWLVSLLSKNLHYIVYVSLKKRDWFPPVRHRYRSCDLGKSVMLSAQLYTPTFSSTVTFWFWKFSYCEKPCSLHFAVKIQILHSKKDSESSHMACEGLAALNTEWYFLCWWRRGENTP